MYIKSASDLLWLQLIPYPVLLDLFQCLSARLPTSPVAYDDLLLLLRGNFERIKIPSREYIRVPIDCIECMCHDLVKCNIFQQSHDNDSDWEGKYLSCRMDPIKFCSTRRDEVLVTLFVSNRFHYLLTPSLLLHHHNHPINNNQ